MAIGPWLVVVLRFCPEDVQASLSHGHFQVLAATRHHWPMMLLILW